MNTRTQDNITLSKAAAKASQKQRFNALVEEHSGIVFKVARTYCWHDDDRHDLQQEIVTQLWIAYPKYDPGLRFSTWMYRIALNVAISYVRRRTLRKRHMVAYDETVHVTADPMGEPNDDPRLEVLQQFIENLEPLNRALMLLYLEEHSYDEIASIIGITKTNVASKLSRLKKKVRALSTPQKQQEKK